MFLKPSLYPPPLKSEFYQSCCCILPFLLFPVLQSLLGLCRVQSSCDHLSVGAGLSPSPFKSVS